MLRIILVYLTWFYLVFGVIYFRTLINKIDQTYIKEFKRLVKQDYPDWDISDYDVRMTGYIAVLKKTVFWPYHLYVDSKK